MLQNKLLHSRADQNTFSIYPLFSASKRRIRVEFISIQAKGGIISGGGGGGLITGCIFRLQLDGPIKEGLISGSLRYNFCNMGIDLPVQARLKLLNH